MLYSQDPEPHLSELAHHFFESAPGGDLEKALDYAQRAGGRALTQLAYEEAARFYQQALQALDLKQRPDPRSQCELLLGRGEALARAGSMAGAQKRSSQQPSSREATAWPNIWRARRSRLRGRYPFAARERTADWFRSWRRRSLP